MKAITIFSSLLQHRSVATHRNFLAALCCLLLTLGVGNAWGAENLLITGSSATNYKHNAPWTTSYGSPSSWLKPRLKFSSLEPPLTLTS